MSKASHEKFDILVHKRDAKTGRVVAENHYRLWQHHGVQYFERPRGSGNLFFANNEPAGRYVEGEFKLGAEHVVWTPPLSDKEKVKQAVAAMQDENMRLQAELNEIKREQKFKETASAEKASKKAAPSVRNTQENA